MDVENIAIIAPCTHEEAHTRLLVWSSAMVETDVVLLPVWMLQDCGIDQLWYEFGSGKHFGIYQYMIAKFSRNIAKALPMFHAFTGCHHVSAFSGRGLQTACKTLEYMPESIQTF